MLADGLIGAWNEAGDRPGDQDAASTTIAHFSADRLNEIERAGDVGIENPQNVGEVLIEKAFAETAAGVGKEGGHGPGPDDAHEFVDTIDGRQIRFERLDLGTEGFDLVSRAVDPWFVCHHDQVETLSRACLGQLIADAGGCTRDDGQALILVLLRHVLLLRC